MSTKRVLPCMTDEQQAAIEKFIDCLVAQANPALSLQRMTEIMDAADRRRAADPELQLAFALAELNRSSQELVRDLQSLRIALEGEL